MPLVNIEDVHWYTFNKHKGSQQKRPPIKKYVIVLLSSKQHGLPEADDGPAIAVGYRKDAAGDKQRPYFVIPGIGGEVLAWCDCLPDNFHYPLELTRRLK